MTPLKILILSGVSGDTRRYRSLHLAEQSQIAGMQVTMAHVWQSGLVQLARRQPFDLAIFQRVALDGTVARILQALKAKGTICLYDTDDLVFDETVFTYIDSPDFADPIRAKLFRKSMQRQRAMLDACDAVLTSTDFLAAQIKALGKQVFVHPNAASLPMIQFARDAVQQAKAHTGQVIIGYASGTPTHDRDFAVAAPAIKAVLLKYPQTWLWLAGEVDPGSGWGDTTDRMRRIQKMPWQQVPAYLASLDINIAPLVAGNPFSESKSAIKYLEAALVSVPTIASCCAAFPQSIHHGENGFLATTSADWRKYLALLVEDVCLRKALGERAFTDVMRDETPQVRSQQWQNTVNELLRLMGQKSDRHTGVAQQVSPGVDLIGSPLTYFKNIPAPNILQRAWVTLWRHGPLELIGNGWIGLRRWLQFIFPFHRT